VQTRPLAKIGLTKTSLLPAGEAPKSTGKTVSPVTFSFRDGAVVVPPDVMELWIQDIGDEGLIIKMAR
jgi:hypothetical protein